MNTSKIPFVIQNMSDEEHELIWELARKKKRYVQVGESKYIFSTVYNDLGPKYYNMDIRSDDVFLLSHPRTGSTWTQEMIWLINNNLDFETAKSKDVYHRFPLLDVSLELTPDTVNETFNKINDEEIKEHLTKYLDVNNDILNNSPSPRFIKSHLPFSLLPPHLLDTTKVVYIARDPRDVAVSLQYNTKLRLSKDEPQKFWNLFTRGLTPWAPIFPHIKEAWALRHHPNMLFLFYEDLINDLPTCLQRMINFYGKMYTERQIQDLCEHLNFNNIKTNPAVNQIKTLKQFGVCNEDYPFIRKGKVGDWRNHFNEDQALEAEEWMKQNLADTDLTFSSFNKY